MAKIHFLGRPILQMFINLPALVCFDIAQPLQMIQRRGHETQVSKSFAEKSNIGTDVKYIESVKNVILLKKLGDK